MQASCHVGTRGGHTETRRPGVDWRVGSAGRSSRQASIRSTGCLRVSNAVQSMDASESFSTKARRMCSCNSSRGLCRRFGRDVMAADLGWLDQGGCSERNVDRGAIDSATVGDGQASWTRSKHSAYGGGGFLCELGGGNEEKRLRGTARGDATRLEPHTNEKSAASEAAWAEKPTLPPAFSRQWPR